jgi:hypothetical protein
MALGFFVIPLLLGSGPYLLFSAVAAGERVVDVKFRDVAVGVDVFQLRSVGTHSSGRRFTGRHVGRKGIPVFHPLRWAVRIQLGTDASSMMEEEVG